MSPPRLGFAGIGWIGRHRLRAVAESGVATVAAIADPVRERAAEAASGVLATDAPEPRICAAFDELLDGDDLDAVVVATPSGLHAAQSIAALERGLHVFCEKPLGRTRREVETVLDAARRADRRLGIDLSYRHIRGVAEMREVVRGGALGTVFAVDLVFHNTYGPDKEWARDPRRAGGGCLIDLGSHLLDLALWCLEGRRVEATDGRFFAAGRRLPAGSAELDATVEDYALGRLDLVGDDGASTAVCIHCSWFQSTGLPARIAAIFRGTEGSAALHNLGGSFYHFVVERFGHTGREPLLPADDATDGDPWAWGRGPIVAWARDVAGGAGYDAGVEGSLAVADALDRLYGRDGR